MKRDIFCANSHLIEPAHVYEGRMPRKWQDRAPRIVDNEGGGQKWIFEGRSIPLRGSCCAVVTPREQRGGLGNLRYEEMRPGFYDSKARLADMDMDGVAVTACYSSPAGVGFGGDMFFYAQDPELGIASMRAWNDWYHEEWVGAAPDRYVPIGCMWYGDPEIAAEEVRRNARRGFKGVVFRNPVDLNLPWLGSGYWDPFFAACQETQTSIIHHTQALETWPHWPTGQAGQYPYAIRSIMFQSCAMEMVTSWLWGGIPARFPDLKIMIAESGGTWLPHLLWRWTGRSNMRRSTRPTGRPRARRPVRSCAKAWCSVLLKSTPRSR